MKQKYLPERAGAEQSLDRIRELSKCERSALKQKEIEKQGAFYHVDGRTQVFIKKGEDVREKIQEYRQKMDSRPVMW